MPFVTIRIVREVIAHDPEGIKAKINEAVTGSIAEAAGIPRENVWLVFDEVSNADWFSGGVRVKDMGA